MTPEQVNRAVYRAPRVYRRYASNLLFPAEAACFAQYHARIAGRDVLDVGVGAGRTTRHLAPLARRYEAIDFSPVMVAFLQSSMPEISVHEADFRDLGIFPAQSFDFILAADNVIDALSHQGRLRALAETSRVLRPAGLFAFTSHNLRYRRAFQGPHLDLTRNPAQLAKNCAKFALGCWNHLRVRRLRQVAADHALINDEGHFYACLHYYASRETVAAQLASANLHLLEARDRAGNLLPPTASDTHAPDLFYIAERH